MKAGKRRGGGDDLDARWMDLALELAERGRYGVSPNPMVGAVIVRDGKLVARAFHRRAGGPHAEAAALRLAGEHARGGDLYLTLEPCAHFGRTPPCDHAIASAGIRRVVVASRDPNPLVKGRGLARLAREGVKIVWSDPLRRRRAQLQNEKFRLWMTEGRPFVLAKWASSLDGRIATEEGASRWITGPEARRRSLLLREEYDAVLVGAGTVAADDPLLTRRLGRNRASAHWRIVLDGRLKVPAKARVFTTPAGCVVVTARPATHPRARALLRAGVEVWSLPKRGRPDLVDLRALLVELAARGVASLMVEGGGATLGSFFDGGLVDRVAAFLAPGILGGNRSVGAVEGEGFALRAMPRLHGVTFERIGRDLLVSGRVAGVPGISRAGARR